MSKVVTYQLTYRTHVGVELCNRCVSEGDHEWGSLGPVTHGLHKGVCQGLNHPGNTPEGRADIAAEIDSVYAQRSNP